MYISHVLLGTEQARDDSCEHEYPTENKRSRKRKNEQEHTHHDDDC